MIGKFIIFLSTTRAMYNCMESQSTPANDMPIKREYRTSEVAKIFGLTRESIMNRIRSGELPAKKFGCQYRIQEDDLIEYLKKYNMC